MWLFQRDNKRKKLTNSSSTAYTTQSIHTQKSLMFSFSYHYQNLWIPRPESAFQIISSSFRLKTNIPGSNNPNQSSSLFCFKPEKATFSLQEAQITKPIRFYFFKLCDQCIKAEKRSGHINDRMPQI